MGIFDSLSTAVAGIQAQSFAVENISGNIANSQTTAFKRTDTAFLDLVPDGNPSQQRSGSVLAYSRSSNTIQGSISGGKIGTNLAISGNGFFIVAQSSGSSDGRPTFTGVDSYTRRGDFSLDQFGYLKNGAGNYLEGIPTDPITGNPVGSTPQPLQITNGFQAAKATTEIDYRANLASTPKTAAFLSGEAGGELLNSGGDYTTAGPFQYGDPRPAPTGGGTVNAGDNTYFINHSVDGGAITLYNNQGAQVQLALRWAKVTNTTGSETWNLFYQTNAVASGQANTTPIWQNVGTNYTFDAGGQLSPAINSVNLGTVTVDGQSISGVTLRHGEGGLTQFQDDNGVVQQTQIDQNGFAAGQLTGVSISDGGSVVGTYTNGRTQKLAQVVLANFNNPDALARSDGNTFQATDQSGVPIVNNGNNIVGSSLESSNVDIADEFSKLIVTQQAYTANTRVITSVDQLLQEVTNLIR